METHSQGNRTSILQNFFLTCLQELYWAETHFGKRTRFHGQSCHQRTVTEAFIEHKEETLQHKQRLEQVFSQMGIPPQAEPCAGLQGLFDEGWQVIDETEAGINQRDVSFDHCRTKLSTTKLPLYGSLITLAKQWEKMKLPKYWRPH